MTPSSQNPCPAPGATLIRPNLLVLALAAAAALLTPRQAGAQRSQGTIAVAATILPVAPALSSPEVALSHEVTGATRISIRRSVAATRTAEFIRLALPGDTGSVRVFIAPPDAHQRMMTMRISDTTSSPVLQRLITAGT